ncbi:MAG: hypothetical protein H6742_11645 [Alphaproteobacteria bacterium]|nr:hypothetical protein [Alphaproteobacteria bacterium]
MRASFLAFSLLLPLLGCAESTYWPEPGMPAYGYEGGGWQECSRSINASVAGTSTLTIRNSLSEPVDLNWIDFDCNEQPYTELASGGTFAQDIDYGYAFVIRNQDNGFIYAHFTWLGDVAEVVVP